MQEKMNEKLLEVLQHDPSYFNDVQNLLPPYQDNGGTQPPQVKASAQAPPVSMISPEKTRCHATKQIMHIAVVVLCFFGLCFTSTLLAQGTSIGPYDYVMDFIFPALTSGPLFTVAMIWSIAELVTYKAQHRKGIHPGFHIGVCLLLGLVAFILGVIGAIFVSMSLSGCEDLPRIDQPDGGCARVNWSMFVGVNVVTFLIAISELIILAFACADVRKR